MHANLILLLALGAALPAATTWTESGGLVVMEAERGDPNPLPTTGDHANWSKRTDHAGYTGTGYLEWKNGNHATSIDSGGKGTITYGMTITAPGAYQLHLRSWPSANTEHNDVWIAFEGAPYRKVKGGTTAGALTGWVKMYNNGGGKWGWATNTVDHDPHQIWVDFPRAGTYLFKLSGRSTQFSIDRIVLRKDGIATGTATDSGTPESSTSGGGGGSNAAPTIEVPTSAVPSTVTGTQTQLSVRGDDDGGEAALVYLWSMVSGPASVSLVPNGTHGARDATATFSRAGTYTLRATVVDGGGLSVTSQIAVTVQATVNGLLISPGSKEVLVGDSLVFYAYEQDQFGRTMGDALSATWTLTGEGSLADGIYTAPGEAGGPYTLEASASAGDALVQVTVVEALSPEPGTSIFAGDDDKRCGIGSAVALLAFAVACTFGLGQRSIGFRC